VTEVDYIYFGKNLFVAVGESTSIGGTVEMIPQQRDCSQVTVTLETSDPALKCTPGPIPMQHDWTNTNCYLLSGPPTDPRSSMVPYTGPPASCTAVRLAGEPLTLTATVHKGGRALTSHSQEVVITAKPGPPPYVNVLVSPKEAVADANGSALFQVTVTGLADCSLATLIPRPPYGNMQLGWCEGPTDLMEGPNGTCITQGPIRCGIDLEAYPDDDYESRHSSRAVSFDLVPNIPDDPRVVNGWNYGDDAYPYTWVYLRDPPNGTKSGPPVTDTDTDTDAGTGYIEVGGAQVDMTAPTTADTAAVPDTSALLPPLSDKVRGDLL
jgi:hypothetical protein